MQTFYSGEDWNTLLEEASNYDFFVSVIVNNKGSIIAKVSQRADIETITTYKYKFVRQEILKEPVKSTIESILVYDCDILILASDNMMDDVELMDKVLEERKKAKLLEDFKYPTVNNFGTQHSPRQFNMFTGYSEAEDKKDTLPLSLRDKVELFIKSCIILDDYGDFADAYTYQQCKEEFETDYKQTDSIEIYKEELSDFMENIFHSCFGNVDMQEVAKITNYFNMFLQDGVVERIIKDEFENFISNYKIELLNYDRDTN